MDKISSAPEAFFDNLQSLSDRDIHFRYDPDTQLRAIIAIDSNQRGPALGGCRCIPYHSSEAALQDAKRLARGMTYKAAISDLPIGGGKAVIMAPPVIKNRHLFFKAFAHFVDSLGGRYITAVDSGTSKADMDIVQNYTNHVVSTSKFKRFPTGDPSPFTALGVFQGIKAAIKHKFSITSLKGIRVIIHGVGHVGFHLAELLSKAGASLILSDVNTDTVNKACDSFKADPCAPEDAHRCDAEIYAPCALGACLNEKTIPELRANIIAGGANNQLKDEITDAIHLKERDVLFAPDYAVNAGGLIYATHQYLGTSEMVAYKKTLSIYDTVTKICKQATKEKTPPSFVANSLAKRALRSEAVAEPC